MLKIKRSIILKNLKGAIERRSLQLKYLADLLLIAASYWMAYYIRFEGEIPADSLITFAKSMPFFVVGFAVCNIYFGLARGMWRYVSIRDLERIAGFVLAGNGLSIISSLIMVPDVITEIPRSIYIINSVLLFLSISGARVFYRTIVEASKKIKGQRENILIIGDQDIAASLQSNILKDQGHKFRIVGFITFDVNRLGSTINASPVAGLLEEVPNLVKQNKVKYIFIAVDSASNVEMKKIIKIAQQSGASVRIVPTMLDVIDGRFSLRDLREVRFEDYLDRKPVEFDMERLKDEFYKKTVLVTGGGGSVGSSICRELIELKPARLIVLDISEHNLFCIANILKDICKKKECSGTEIIYKITDINDESGLKNLFEANRIDYVIHAAAHKHVPLSELNPVSTITVNVHGTLNLISAALKFEVKKFVYISTDKAVDPVSVMGATKRLGELLIKSVSSDRSIKTEFMAVRFGNVIGSSGNVVEIFTNQLQQGGPLTITDPEMERYFMSLDEATKLILQAISIGGGGEIFVLNMGKPVKIKDLAYDIALFYGKYLKEGDIIYTGKREGERLSEKLFNQKENKVCTHSRKIFKAEEDIYIEGLMEKAKELCALAKQQNEAKALECLFSLISPLKE